MSNKPFQFKQFSVAQDKTAMKIGTDGVLLGAWAIHLSPKKILDIGTGTGVIALMMAQRFPSAEITAIDIDEDAFLQAKDNFVQSKWSDRLTAIHSSLQNLPTDTRFDLIISNPPFFNQSYLPEEANRAKARHTTQLSFEDIILCSKNILSDNGAIALIIPYEYEEILLSICKQSALYPQQICRVKGRETVHYKRSLLLLSAKNTTPIVNKLVIEKERHIYTDAYIDLVKDFYLKM